MRWRAMDSLIGRSIIAMLRSIIFILLIEEVTMNIPALELASTPRPLSEILGVCHINGIYHLPEPGKDYLNEGADKIYAMGSRSIKVIIRDSLQGYYPFDTWPAITSLVQAAKIPTFKDLFAKPFKTYILMTFRPGKPIHYFTAGVNAANAEAERKAYYDFTKYLLTQYAGSGKTFIFQNWEGDWVLTPPTGDPNAIPDPAAVQGMIDWLNARQNGVEQARNEVGMNGVWVYHAAEVNLLAKAMAGKPCVTNSVLPFTHCDLYSYSAYDTMTQGPALFRQSLDYLASKAPDSQAFGDKNIYLGEYGWPENLIGEPARLNMMRETVETALSFGVRYAMFWELYCDGLKNPDLGGKPPTNADMAGNWLIRPDGSRSVLWDYFQGLYASDQKSAARDWAAWQ